MSLVPESTLRRLAALAVERDVAFADLAIDSDQSLLESDSHARFALPEAICLIKASTLLLRSLFFFCIQVLMS